MDLEDLPRIAPAQRRDVLAICGGGYAGLFAAEFLRRLEGHLGAKSSARFDLIAGTSIGGILALGLAQGLSGKDLSELLEGVGPKIFGRPGLGLSAPKHDPTALRAALTKAFGAAKLSDLPIQVLIPAISLTAGETVLFRNAPGDPTRNEKLIDVALATSAAPYYLPPHRIDDRLFTDGGLAANSPEAAAVIDAISRRRWRADRTAMLVVGSTQRCARIPGHLIGAGWGIGRWGTNRQLVTTTMRAQMSLARQIAAALLGPDGLHVADVELSRAEEKVIRLDKATPKATQALKTLASDAFDRFSRHEGTYLDRLTTKSPTSP